jgi:isoprenylcysteine carboxyl methyltransferase (ICMT) family protein YpbQ
VETRDNGTGKSLGETLFRLRDYTPIPLIILMLFIGKPTASSAILGTLLVVIGELFRIYSVAFIGSISRTRKGSLGGALVTSGPFAFVRNPLYVANFFILFGFAVLSASFGLVLFSVLLFAFQYYWIVQYEEGLLAAKFGQAYADYQLQVPAWMPKKCPALAELEWPTSYSAALKSERRTLTTILVLFLVLMFLGSR